MNILTYVIVPASSNLTLEQIPTYLDELLDPFDENKEVPKYTEPCFCINRVAMADAAKAAEAHVGKTLEQLELEFWNTHDPDGNLEDYVADWTLHLADYNNCALDTLKHHKLYEKPNPKCLECKGKGKVELNLNPNGKWSSWEYTNFSEQFPTHISLIESDPGNGAIPIPQAILWDNKWFDLNVKCPELRSELYDQYTDLLGDNQKGFIVALNCRRSP